MVNLFAERNLVELYVGFLAEMEKKYPVYRSTEMNMERYAMRISFLYFTCRCISTDVIPTTISSTSS